MDEQGRDKCSTSTTDITSCFLMDYRMNSHFLKHKSEGYILKCWCAMIALLYIFSLHEEGHHIGRGKRLKSKYSNAMTEPLVVHGFSWSKKCHRNINHKKAQGVDKSLLLVFVSLDSYRITKNRLLWFHSFSPKTVESQFWNSPWNILMGIPSVL